METLYKVTEHFTGVETTEEHNGYFCSVGEALTIVILGSICGLRNISQIHQWVSLSDNEQWMEKATKSPLHVKSSPFWI